MGQLVPALQKALQLMLLRSIAPCAAASPEAAEAAIAAGATRIYASSDALSEGSWPDGVIP